MFGYVVPEKPYLYLKDETLYNALYCGLCKSIKIECGNTCRFTLNYDLAFLSALSHNIMGLDVTINREKCIAHQIKKRPIAKPDDLSKKIASLNVILAYYKLKDDKIDENKGGFKSSLFKKGYKKAKKNCPEFDVIVKECYQDLLKLEDEKCQSVDIVSDCFASMLSKISCELFQEKSTEHTKNLMYALGKWIYLIDALDDYDKDIKNNNYNVFYECYKLTSFEQLISNNGKDLHFVFSTIFALIKDSYSNIQTKYNTDLIQNILFRGIPAKTLSIFNKKTVKNTK